MSKLIFSNKLKILVSLLLVFVAVAIAARSKEQASQDTAQIEKKPVEVSTRKVGDLKNLRNELRFAGTVVGDQEIKVVAQAAGVVSSVNFDLGSRVAQGKVLATIDDQGNLLSSGDNNLKSAQVRQLELAVEQAKKAYGAAKDNYDNDKTDANKTARDIAKLQYESAKVGLNNSLNARTATAPISGIVTSRQVSVGDAVSPGQLLATISKTNLSKVRFYLSADEMKSVAVGSQVEIRQDSVQANAKVTNVSPQAEYATGKFLIEAAAEKGKVLPLGTIADVWLKTSESSADGQLFLPISALTTTQSGNYIFIAQNGVAKKVTVSVSGISGETATVETDLADDVQIIIEGSKLIGDGDKIQIK